ncbi:hypothetical protein CYY_006215 [Polysphondylium violaceum]|uniref:Transmembrane protein n=1 Tax=Polysphondylium violaceum TaxID=133409 RepID=A0A8J4PQW6_9MYCE|nr:hypothetical protein CYY_006215 [Polysphondylium violaceum]
MSSTGTGIRYELELGKGKGCCGVEVESYPGIFDGVLSKEEYDQVVNKYYKARRVIVPYIAPFVYAIVLTAVIVLNLKFYNKGLLIFLAITVSMMFLIVMGINISRKRTRMNETTFRMNMQYESRGIKFIYRAELNYDIITIEYNRPNMVEEVQQQQQQAQQLTNTLDTQNGYSHTMIEIDGCSQPMTYDHYPTPSAPLQLYTDTYQQQCQVDPHCSDSSYIVNLDKQE